ncbi:hypothetical protein SUGI_1073830 [Cryptomeria japonica]|nr:hypothetical protein SUGI_1073830 [Cryptomeria japonica]
MGVKAKPLDGSASLKAKHLYFLVELPKIENFQRAPRRVRSGITLDAKSRLENLLLARRSISDISVMKYEPAEAAPVENGAVRLKVRLTRAQLDKMMAESQDSSETAEKILQTCFENAQKTEKEEEEPKQSGLAWKPALGSIPETCHKAQGNRVRFHLAQNEQVF